MNRNKPEIDRLTVIAAIGYLFSIIGTIIGVFNLITGGALETSLPILILSVTAAVIGAHHNLMAIRLAKDDNDDSNEP